MCRAGLSGEKVRTGEYARVQFEAEHPERVHVASAADRIARLGIESRSIGGRHRP